MGSRRSSAIDDTINLKLISSLSRLLLSKAISVIKLKPGTNLPEISLRDVAMHDGAASCWIIIYDRVYDITQFLAHHPGGNDVLLEYAGRDASMAFRGHSKFAVLTMKQYEIGELPDSECIFRCPGKMLIDDLPQ